MFITFKNSYIFHGSKYAADGLKPIIFIWCSVKDSLKMPNVVPCGIISGGRDTGLPWHTNHIQGINQVVIYYSECGKWV